MRFIRKFMNPCLISKFFVGVSQRCRTESDYESRDRSNIVKISRNVPKESIKKMFESCFENPGVRSIWKIEILGNLKLSKHQKLEMEKR